MEVQRRLRAVHIQEQENSQVIKGKANNAPLKKQGLAVRGALGDLNTNAQVLCDNNSVGKVALTTAEFEKKSSLRRVKSYNHVQSKVDTGRALKPIQPSSRPPLRREESTAGLAAKANARNWAAQVSKLSNKENVGTNISTKHVDSKKTNRLGPIKENIIANSATTSKPMQLKESTESLQKLKIEEKTSIINVEKLRKHGKPEQTKKVARVDLDTTPELPSDIEDIDAADSNKLTLMTIYIKDIYRYLRQLEDEFPIEQDYLKKQIDILPRMRATLIDWLVEVHQEFKQTQESLQITISIIDRYLQVTHNVPRSRLQLVGISAMYVACKYEEVYPPDVSDFIYVTAGTFTKQEVFECERDIMLKLGFCLAKPPPLYFLRRFVKAARGDSRKHNLAKYLVELCLVDYSMVHYKPSELSAAAVCLSLLLLTGKSQDQVWNKTLQYYSGYTIDCIEPIMRQIVKIVANVENSKHQSVYKKYQSMSNSKVATLPELKSDALQKFDFSARQVWNPERS